VIGKRPDWLAVGLMVSVEAAKKAGKVSYYTSIPVNAANEIAKRFEAKYGIKMELFRSVARPRCSVSRPRWARAR
jgi:hypothetical protein